MKYSRSSLSEKWRYNVSLKQLFVIWSTRAVLHSSFIIWDVIVDRMNIHKDGCFCDECEHFPSGKDIIYCYRFVIYAVILLYLFLWKYKLIQGLLYIRINAHELLMIKINTNLCIVWVILRGKLESFEDSVRSRVVICRMTVIDTTQTVTCVVYIKAVCDVSGARAQRCIHGARTLGTRQ